MFINTLRRLIGVAFICSCAFVAMAQQDHFVYLQTQNGQPFYIKMNNKLTSSSAAGYIIIPRLNDGDYHLTVGFPKNEFPETSFNITVNNNAGFLLKNFDDKGWGLFNLQSYAVVMGGGDSQTVPVSTELQNDAFSKMLASVVKDSSLLQKNETITVSPQSTKSDSTTIHIAKTNIGNVDSANVNVENTVSSDTTSNLPEQPALVFSPAKQLLSKSNKDGLEMVYSDTDDDGNDTVRIFIPAAKNTPLVKDTVVGTAASHGDSTIVFSSSDTASNERSNTIATSDKPSPGTSSPVFLDGISSIKNKDTVAENRSDISKKPVSNEKNLKTEEKPAPEVSDSTVIDTAQESDTASNTSGDKLVVLPKVVKSSKVNSDCKAFADNEYFLRLRKKMASENSDENMIKAARRAFHSKCFSTEQIRNLSLLFLTDEGKYRFFDEAYAFASNSDQYYSLQSQLKDPYYINRFKAMIHQ